MHLFALDGNYSALEDLLKTHSDVNLEINDNNGQTPLNIAARQGYLEIVEVLKLYLFNYNPLIINKHSILYYVVLLIISRIYA